MEKIYSGKKRNYIAAVLCMILLLLIFWFIWITSAKQVITEYSSEYVALAELPSQLSFTYYEEDEWEEKLKTSLHVKNLNGKLTYGQLSEVLKQLSVQQYIDYQKKFSWKIVSRPLWDQIYKQVLDLLDTNHQVSDVGLVFLTDEGQEDSGERLTQKGYFQVAEGVDYFQYYDMYQVYVKEERIIGISSVCEETLTLENVFIHNTENEKAEVLYQKQKLSLDIEGLKERITDTICDMEWKDHKVTAVYKKEDKISGKVLSFDEKKIEISGYGSLTHTGKLKVYKTYGTVEELDESKLVIGNLQADFVVAKKQVCGIILKEPAAIENIRVLLLNPEGSVYHGEPLLVADVDGTITIGKKEKKLKAGKVIKAAKFLGEKVDYVKISLNDENGRIYFSDKKGNHTSLGYRGTMEIREYPEGYGVVNELSLEQYLYGVVPSEMPASYERAALCTQAVCARSYACIHLMRGDYAAFGAHVDDSTNYQVYNKQAEDENTTLAVDDTIGEVVKYQGEVAETYFFSTSCGYTADMGVWDVEPTEANAYLQGICLVSDGSEPDISNEDKFTEFIKNQEIEAFDSESPLFRWHAELLLPEKAEIINTAIAARFQATSENVQITKEDGTAGTEADLAAFGAPKNISVEERCASGAVKRLCITYEKGNVVLISEYNIRYVLGKAVTGLVGKDGQPIEMELLPSAYCALIPVEKGYVLYGGGYGHGIGMCQNGANGMAKSGMNYVDILTKFYHDITIENIYNEEKAED